MISTKTILRQQWLLPAAMALAAISPVTANAEDIDIFVAGAAGGGAANVLVLIDNTASWADNAQHWPQEDCDPVAFPGLKVTYQGQAELCALMKVVPSLNDSVRLGLMLFNQNGLGACCSGGYVRYAMRPMTQANRDDLVNNYLKPLFVNFSDPANKAADNASYAMGIFDAYKYFGGWASPDPNTWVPGGNPQDATHFGVDVFATPSSTFPKPDQPAYTDTTYRHYVPPPASAADECGGKDYLIFIGNGRPNVDTLPQENMQTILEGVGGNSAQIPMPVLTTISTTTSSTIDYSAACYANNANGLKKCNTDNALTCGPSFDTCACGNPTTKTGCMGNNVKYSVIGTLTTTVAVPTGQTAVPTGNRIRYADEFTRFLHTADVSQADGQQAVTTFTIDVFNAKQDADQTALLYSMASAGGGQYYAAKNRNNLEFALGDIFAKIQAANSVFASASLPVNATNRAVTANEVYLGVFRPDPDARPLWYGNLKRYKIGNFAGSYDLADASGAAAVNPLTGFLGDCATSFWTSDSGQYWAGISSNPPPFGKCPVSAANPFSPYSDAPDGPLVEKGGVAEVIRKGNTVASDFALHRTLKTKGFVNFDISNAPSLPQEDVDFVSGFNVDAAGNYLQYNFDPSDPTKTTALRATLHGDVVHSRPRAVNYPSGQTVVYYGANDGWLRAADAATGKEVWGYMAEEFYSTLPRLRQNSPLIAYSFITQQSIDPPPEPKNYHFDGSIGGYQSLDNSDIRIFPTMRRGGRMLYAFNVTAPASPSLMWKKGCPSLTSDAGCTPDSASPDFTSIGQTWSTPRAAKLKIDVNGISSTTPMLVVGVGGGYHACEDGSPDDPCIGAKGSVVYILNANNGAILRSFSTATTDAGTNPNPGRVAADVAYVDLDNDGIPDFAYAVDTRGNIYRLGFGMSRTAPLDASLWTWTLVAYTSGSNRKFLYAPAVFPATDGAGHNFVYLALGTGDREQPLITQYPCGGSAAPPAACGSVSTPVLNRFYVYLDDVSGTTATNLDDTTSLCDFTDSTTRALCTTLTPATDSCSNSIIIPGSGKSGWFMDLKAACAGNANGCGEQTVTSAAIVGGFVAFSTNRPVPAVANACAPFGEARGYAVNLFSASGVIGAQPDYCGGTSSDTFVGGGLPPSPVVADVNVDGKVVPIGIGIVSLNGGPNSAIEPQKVFTLPPQARKRIYWRQEGGS